MTDALAKGLAFLAARQDPAGFWEDWDLPVGSSRMWTTAYAGWRLAVCGSAAAGLLEPAAAWLLANELDEGGWGYAESTGADADSTALGILFLYALGRPAPATALRRLLSFSRDDGGFATYGFHQSFGAWTESHAEVTATAALALRSAGAAPQAVERAAAWLRAARRPDGLWNSYWWTSPFYATEMAARVLNDPMDDPAHALRDLHPANSFEQALRTLVLRGDDASDLFAAQNPDGSWPSAPALRLPSRDIPVSQTSEDACPCFADPHRIFTTATVVCALSSRPPQIAFAI